ncbi:MAG: RNA chaperone Hfq [Terracidiphilus sp.]|jgi:sRNA-binding regulator protein Hfq
MSLRPTLPRAGNSSAEPSARVAYRPASALFSSHTSEAETARRQAESFYLQKQIQAQTPMIVVLEDGEQIEGCIEWYDRDSLKIRGRQKTLVYKSAIKYMYKAGDAGL